jgi:hypothetical protein
MACTGTLTKQRTQGQKQQERNEEIRKAAAKITGTQGSL